MYFFKPIAEQDTEYGSESSKTIYCKYKFLYKYIKKDVEGYIPDFFKWLSWEFPGSPVVRIPLSHCREPMFNPLSGN